MGDRSRAIRSSGLRLLLRVLSVVAALFVLSVSGRASAATLLVVPMCGERGESIAAPPIFRDHDSGSIIASPCHTEVFELGKSAPLAPERVVVHERPERVLGFAAFRLTQTDCSRCAIVSARKEPARPGFVDALFRPPCA